MLVSVNFVIHETMVTIFTPARSTSATATTDTRNKIMWELQCGYI